MRPRLRCLPPVVDARTRLVVLGSFPGERSLREQQYYAHPQNQFWRIVGALLNEPLDRLEYRARLSRLLRHGVGLWDVYASCRRVGSSDTAIRDARVNRVADLRAIAPKLCVVVHNGLASARAPLDWHGDPPERFVVPSSSPANATLSIDEKIIRWRPAFERARVIA